MVRTARIWILIHEQRAPAVMSALASQSINTFSAPGLERQVVQTWRRALIFSAAQVG